MTKATTEKTIFSGIQPTGALHIGNLIGAIDLWVQTQKSFGQVIFCVVDMHSITVNPVQSKLDSLYTAKYYIACGIDPNIANIFLQSSVKEHAELCWILSCITPIGWLNRMTQFKEKSSSNKENSSLGLYSYPVLMAADILLYNADFVPVGQDQVQHLELTRDIAQRFNKIYSVNHFVLPDTLQNKSVTRVMSLCDGTKKMSKSEKSENSRINISDNKDTIAKKIKSAKTDSVVGFDAENLESRPEVNNLISILSHLTKKTKDTLCKDIKNCSDLKSQLTDALVQKLLPIQQNAKEISDAQVTQVLNSSAESVRQIASKNINKIKKIVGFF